MFARSIFASYYRLLTGASLAFAMFALGGCNEKAAEAPAPGRPVLIATVHYAAETPERSFVGTIRPRIGAEILEPGNDLHVIAHARKRRQRR